MARIFADATQRANDAGPWVSYLPHLMKSLPLTVLRCAAAATAGLISTGCANYSSPAQSDVSTAATSSPAPSSSLSAETTSATPEPVLSPPTDLAVLVCVEHLPDGQWKDKATVADALEPCTTAAAEVAVASRDEPELDDLSTHLRELVIAISNFPAISQSYGKPPNELYAAIDVARSAVYRELRRVRLLD